MSTAASAWLLVLPFCEPGCTQPAPLPPPRPVVRISGATNGDSAGGDRNSLTLDQAVDSDPCALRMRDLEELLLVYYAVNRQFPAQLTDLSSYADADKPLTLKCAFSPQPFGYDRFGMVSGTRARRLLAWTPVPNRSGLRWCVAIPPAAPGGRATNAAQSLEVVPVPEADFKQFRAGD